MLPSFSWSSWALDTYTWGWIVWIVFFFVWETLALLANPYSHPLTAHLRPVFLAHSLAWFIAVGLWLWLGTHFLLPIPRDVFTRG